MVHSARRGGTSPGDGVSIEREDNPMIRELDRVILAADLPEHGLKSGDVGTVVLAHDTQGYEVEFITLDGETLAVVSLFPNQLRPIGRREIAHARAVAAK